MRGAAAGFLGLDWRGDHIAAAVRANALAHVRAGGSVIPLAGEAAARGRDTVIDSPAFVRRGTPGGWRTDLAWESSRSGGSRGPPCVR